MGNVLTMVRMDANRILSKMGYETDITIIKLSVSYTVKGLGIVHHLTFDTDGQPVNSKNAHISIHEQDLIDAGLIVRNSNNEVYMRDCLVQFSDFSGVVKKYAVKENYADDTLGVIVLILGNAG